MLIASVLEKIHGLSISREATLGFLAQFLQSTFIGMFGPNVNGSEQWPLTKVGNLASSDKDSIRTGPFGSQLKHSEFATTRGTWP